MSEYVVYVAKYDGEVVYVGEGKCGRESHLTSGISHCYDANRYHFTGKVVEVVIVSRFDNKADAVKHEVELIKKLKPKWNKVVSGGMSQMSKHRWCSKVIKTYNITSVKQQKLLHYLVKRFGVEDTYVINVSEITSAVPELNSSFLSRVSSDKYYSKFSKVIKATKLNKSEYELKWLVDGT